MDFDFNANQQALRDAVVQMVDDNREVPRIGNVVEPRTWYPAERLERDLAEGGFFDVALTPECDALDAATLVYETALTPLVVEAAGSALIGPLLTGRSLPRPVAVARLEDLTRGVRFLNIARTLIVDMGDDVAILSLDGAAVETLGGVYAYPIGRFTTAPDMGAAERLGPGKVDELRRLWRLGIALEIGAAMQAAIDFTTDYVKQRHVFGRPVGSFQAVQHRLSADAEKSRGIYWMAMKAAWNGSPLDAALAALHAQRATLPVNYDMHQFNGALGMTLEHTLHCWTFRLRWLVGEMGGYGKQAAAVAALAWPEKASAA